VAHFDPSTGTFQEWAIPTAGANPIGIATTSVSGSLEVWGTEFAKDKLFVFLPATGVFSEYSLPNVNSGAEYVSIEPPGTYVRVWFTEILRNANGEAIYDPGTGAVTLYEDTFPAGVNGANGLYAGPGSVWYAGTSGLVRWDRASGQYSVWPLPSHGSAGGRFLALDALGQPWYTQGVQSATGADNYVGVLRGDNTIKEWQVPTIGADPRLISINQLTQHPWIGEQSSAANNARVAELDPSAGGSVVAAPPTTSPSGGAPVGLPPVTSAPVGASTNVVAPATAPITGVPNGQFNEYALASASQPHDAIVDSSGNTWVLEAGANKVAKITGSTPDFGLNASPLSVSVAQGASDGVTIIGTSILSYSGSVTLSVTGVVPTGVTFSSFTSNPINIPGGGTNSATLTVSVASSVPAASYPITVSGTDGSATHTAAFTLVVTPGADFSLALSTPGVSVAAGGSVTDTATLTSIGGFNSAVALSTTGVLPSGVHVSFSPNSVTPPSGGSLTSTVTVNADPGTVASVATLSVVGTSGSLTHSDSLTITVTVLPDFTLTANPTSLAMSQGSSGTSTITVGSTNGFSSAVTLTYSWVGSAPSGVSITLPGPVTPPSGSTATSTLTASADSSSSTGSFTLQVTGSSGSMTHNVNVGVTISSAAATSSSSSTTAPPAPKCLIATAAYGSQVAPEVKLLRNFRDNSIMKTQSGSSFMLVFNAWYYSFSPGVAAYLSTHWVERTVMKGVLYPLVGILYLTSNLFSATSAYPELAVLISGLLASSLIGAFYLGVPLGVLRARFRRLRNWKGQRTVERALAAMLLGGLGTLTFGELLSSQPALIVSTATIMLSTLFISTATASKKISNRL
jgi:streptogramin lyase